MLGTLTAAHLVEAAPGGAGWWRMHDLMRLYTQRLSDAFADVDAHEHARNRLFGYYRDMAGAATSHLRALPGTTMPDTFLGRDDALAWLDAERACLIAAIQMAASTSRDDTAMPSTGAGEILGRLAAAVR